MVDSKGIGIAQDVSKLLKLPIKFVGPQNMENKLVKDNPYAEYIHTVSVEERKSLLSNARCLIMPSLYAEPCGWTMIESFISGTPVISTDWGGLSEFNVHGETGFRCRSLNEFVHATNISHKIKPEKCREHAYKNFTIKKMCERYEVYLESLIHLKKYSGPSYVLPTCDFIVRP
jgi:glycosyltransferase involved in cell wall biosynthesis